MSIRLKLYRQIIVKSFVFLLRLVPNQFRLITLFLFLMCTTVFSACSLKNEKQNITYKNTDSITSENLTIETRSAIVKSFSSKIISNGKIISNQEIPIFFQKTELIKDIAIKNGALVKSGQLLAALNNHTQKLLLTEAKLQLDESLAEINDQLIVQGGKAGDTNSVNHEVYAYIKLRSGYNRALVSVQKAELELLKTFVYAPISGIVANLDAAAYTLSQTDKPFCTVINQDNFFLECPILESELANVSINQDAQIEVVGNSGIFQRSKVVAINPVVNVDGLITVRVQILNANINLFSGMNARVFIEKRTPHCLVVPKEAVVERSGRKVIFTYVNGVAKWNYVTIGKQNDNEVTVVDGLHQGDEVIVSGNINLAHDVKVNKITVPPLMNK